MSLRSALVRAMSHVIRKRDMLPRTSSWDDSSKYIIGEAYRSSGSKPHITWLTPRKTIRISLLNYDVTAIEDASPETILRALEADHPDVRFWYVPCPT